MIAGRSGFARLIVGLVAGYGVLQGTAAGLHSARGEFGLVVADCVVFILVLAGHLLLFTSMPWRIAAASLVLAASMSFPLSYLYELGGHTIWPPAIVHFVAQAALKVIALPEARTQGIAIAWIAACTVLPWVVFLVRHGRAVSDAVRA